ncbi:MAG: DEAD/DEAH box helicase [Clostridiales bacterium]|nr:DEAD/DEAH box helicase [Clostridiales bacterium]
MKYPISRDGVPGLRNAQIGAIHAIAAHDTLSPLDASVIVMPTGSGKTSVLMMAPYVLQKQKVLVVTPSAMVRGQIVDDYKKLKTLKAIGVFDEEVPAPTVYEAEQMFDENQKDAILSANVVVASHKVALSISKNMIKEEFDYIIIDEAHHVPAPTWQEILFNMKNVSSLLVTATPFRLDKKEINGTHIYNYPLSKAYRDGVFGSITFIPIEESTDKDRCIALETERVLLNDRASGYNHYIMARTDTKEKAKNLEEIYSKFTKLKLKRIDSSMSYRTVTHTIKALREQKLDGIICVDMLGEGFDFPNLKIAAIHEPQKSLASTLQFVGRFARTNALDVGPAKFIAMNDETLRIENRKLYTSDSVWQDMIIEMSEKKIGGDIENSDTIKQFSRPETGEEIISLHNVRPNCHARVYKVSNFNFDAPLPKELNVGNNLYKSLKTKTIVGISSTKEVPLWLEGSQAVNTKINLYIVHYQEKTNLLFIYSQQKTEIVYDLIVKSFCEKYSKIPRDEMNRVLAGFTNYEFFNTGMQNKYAESGESYRIYAGSNTASSINETTGKMLSAGHAFCKATQNDLETTIGYSSGSKLWSSAYLSIPEYIEWCDSFGSKIANNSIIVKTNTNYDKLPIWTQINNYQDNILFGFYSEKAYISPPQLRIKEEKVGLLVDGEIKNITVSQEKDKVFFDFVLGEHTDNFSCDINGKYLSKSNKFVCRDGIHTISLSQYFLENPLIFKTADDTVYTGYEVLYGNINHEQFDNSQIIDLDWECYNTNIKIEFDLENKKNTVHKSLQTFITNDSSYSIILQDHGSGEVADYITLKTVGSMINVELFHCKAMKGENYNSSINDVYEVAQQAIKSTVWLKSKAILLEKLLYRLTNSSNTKFIRGNLNTLKSLLKSQKALEATIFIVQPALSKSTTMKDTVGTVLSAASFYLSNTGRVKELKFIGSK